MKRRILPIVFLLLCALPCARAQPNTLQAERCVRRYPKASATAFTPAWSLDNELIATAPYFDFTESRVSAMPPFHVCDMTNICLFSCMRQVAYNVSMRTTAKYNMERFFQALGNNTRMRLLNLLGEREVCVCEFVEVLAQPQPMISQHLACLRSVGIVEARRQGKWMHYRIVTPPHAGAAQILKQTLAWMQEDKAMLADRTRHLKTCCDTTLAEVATMRQNTKP